ncbi:hypothetical protein HID58_034851 [Brassica napus]|uniref:BRX domain-containing protein n=1 Tax=Brassica napus TaxID=3708 RepID=A0ABQ8C4X1_BRANA|nr:hypothetical protein HID58_034851 [Brassica napus]
MSSNGKSALSGDSSSEKPKGVQAESYSGPINPSTHPVSLPATQSASPTRSKPSVLCIVRNVIQMWIMFLTALHLLTFFINKCLFACSREMFDKWEAQKWWGENFEKVMELYNVPQLNKQSVPVPTAPPRSKDELSSISGTQTETSSVDMSARSSGSSREEEEDGDYSMEVSVGNASDMETEWVEQDDSTIRALPDGTRELRRVRFSRDRFGETNARLWWEENRARIQQHLLGNLIGVTKEQIDDPSLYHITVQKKSETSEGNQKKKKSKIREGNQKKKSETI